MRALSWTFRWLSGLTAGLSLLVGTTTTAAASVMDVADETMEGIAERTAVLEGVDVSYVQVGEIEDDLAAPPTQPID